MAHPLPQQRYSFGITDTDRWRHFESHSDDIFVITPAKCGTTWMQTIVTFLVFGKSELPFVPAERSPWFDCVLAPIEETLATLSQDEERRIIKTHTPLDGVPFSESTQYIGVYRDPRDAFMSWLNHEQNMVINTADSTQTVDERFFAYVDQDYQPGEPDNCLAAMIHHLECLGV